MTVKSVLFVVGLLAALPGSALAGVAQVRFHEGRVSAIFEAVPAGEAFEAIRQATGVALGLPPSVEGRTLTLSVAELPMELFLDAVRSALGLAGIALSYEPAGVPDRLIVVDRTGSSGPRAAQPGGPPMGYPVEKEEKLRPQIDEAEPPPGPPPDSLDPGPGEGEKKTTAASGEPGTGPEQAPLVSEAEVARAREASEAALAAFPLTRGDPAAASADRILPFPAPDGSPIPIPGQ